MNILAIQSISDLITNSSSEVFILDTGVVPNYTTNGLILARDNVKGGEILAYTKEYVGGVAVSLGNPSIRLQAHRASY